MSADGTWNVAMNTPMGTQNGVLTLAVDGDSLSGNMSGPQGKIELTDGKVEGDSYSWNAAMTTPMPMTLEFSAKVEGDNISGDVKLGAFGTSTFTGTRA